MTFLYHICKKRKTETHYQEINFLPSVAYLILNIINEFHSILCQRPIEIIINFNEMKFWFLFQFHSVKPNLNFNKKNYL